MMPTSSPLFDPVLSALAECPMPVIATDCESRVRLWNRAATELLGQQEREVLGQRLPTLSEAQHKELDLNGTADLQDIGARDVLQNWKNKTGDTIGIRIRVTPWFGPTMVRRGAFFMLTPVPAPGLSDAERTGLIEELNRARKLADEAQRFRALLEAAPDAIVKVDPSGHIVLMNRATETLFGYTRDELLGQPVEILVPAASRGAHIGQRTGYWKNPQTRPMGRGLTLSGVRKDGTEFPVEISLSPIDAGGEMRVVAIIRDVAERRRIEQEMRAMEDRFNRELKNKNAELEKRNREVEEADRLKSEFLASMSHELRTPLHTIIGFSQLLMEEIQGPLNEKQQRFVNHIHHDSQHLLELINDILDLSKIESGSLELQRETFRARAEMKNILEGVQQTAESKSIDLTLTAPEDYALHADIRRFREVLLNLLSNALKFTPRGGSVAVSMSPASEPGFCRFAVRDTGVGIAPEQLDAIFDKFYQVGSTTKGVREGTGLGLAITKHIVELHGGQIRVDSSPGRGSCFSFTMPLDSGGRW